MQAAGLTPHHCPICKVILWQCPLAPLSSFRPVAGGHPHHFPSPTLAQTPRDPEYYIPIQIRQPQLKFGCSCQVFHTGFHIRASFFQKPQAMRSLSPEGMVRLREGRLDPSPLPPSLPSAFLTSPPLPPPASLAFSADAVACPATGDGDSTPAAASDKVPAEG